MPTADEYAERIQRYNLSRLVELWALIKGGVTSGWEAGKAFEYLVLRAFQLEGADVRWPYSVRLGEEQIEQIDGVVYAEGLACVLESKDYAKAVNVEPIAKLRNQLLRRPASTLGLVFSRNGFTSPAKTLAQFTVPQTILLWDGTEVEYALQKSCFRRALLRKYRFFIEHGIPDYNICSEVV
jgi:hypothetical protein